MDSNTLLSELYLNHRRPLLDYARRLTGDAQRGEDVVQETLLRAWLNASKLWVDQPSAVRAWLFRVARNIAVDDVRAIRARPTEVYAAPPLARSVGDVADGVLDAVEVSRALRRLPPAYRRVLVNVFLRDQTVAATAHALGIPVGTAKSRLRDGLRRLRENLREAA
jgi:RNA polymerase sigma-70 factor (ECF subfamily)